MKHYLLLFILFISISLLGQKQRGQNVNIDSLRKVWQKEYALHLLDTSKSILQIIPSDNYFSNLISDESDLMYVNYQFVNAQNDTIKKTASDGEIIIRLQPGTYKIIITCLNTYYFQDTIDLHKSTFTKINLVFDMTFRNIVNRASSIVNYDIIDFNKFSSGQTLEKSMIKKH